MNLINQKNVSHIKLSKYCDIDARLINRKKIKTLKINYKKASRSNPANYRPVSLICISCKLLEHIVNRHILNHLDAHKILADSQHGFRKRRSCETQLLLTCHDLTRAIDKCGQVDMLVLDFAKAFDTLAYERLLAKIHSYGITSSLYKWIESFLKR